MTNQEWAEQLFAAALQGPTRADSLRGLRSVVVLIQREARAPYVGPGLAMPERNPRLEGIAQRARELELRSYWTTHRALYALVAQLAEELLRLRAEVRGLPYETPKTPEVRA